MVYIPNFINKEQEKELLSLCIESFRKGDERNSIKRWGSMLPYSSYLVSSEIPKIFYSLNIPSEFNSVTLNEYHKGQFIDYHYDLPKSGNKILVLSLLGKSDVYFKDNKGIKVKYKVEPNSLYIIEKELRWQWKHSSKALDKRFSFVFRNSDEFLECDYLCSKCDTYHTRNSVCYDE